MKRVCLGGTFDILHAGHARLLEAALAAGKALVIGLASDEFAAGRRPPDRELALYGAREVALRDWFAARDALERVEIVSLAEEWGPAAEGADIDGIVVSEGTREAAARLNARRLARGLAPLEVVTVPHLLAADGLPLSASRIRAGEVDAEGRRR
ncbi:MAG: pantetheine-phosphate adenylyltransferase [Candidatus Poseidoniia archaeon]|nr:pantetheine-phosphate adenylyltransferase [Candidatus Poseidoniia archaeon]